MTKRNGWLACAGLCVYYLVMPGVSAVQPTGSPAKFDVNDVSYLWPVPATQAEVDTLITAGDKTPGGTPLWPAAAFDRVIAMAQKTSIPNGAGDTNTITFDPKFKEAFGKPATWKVVSFRADPTSTGGHDGLAKAFGEMAQLRLVLQPVTVDVTGKVKVHDFAAHLVFAYFLQAPPPFKVDTAAFGTIVDELEALKAAAGVSTAGKLGVHPGLASRDPEFARKVKAFVLKHATPARLFAVSFMGVEVPEPWIFFALRMDPSTGTLVEAPQAVLHKTHAQMLGMLNLPRVQPLPVPTNVDPAAGKGVSTSVLFDDETLGKLDEPAIPGLARPANRDIPDLIANPKHAHFFNTDCVSCHTESARRVKVAPGASRPFAYTLPAGISGGDEALMPKRDWNVRNFGWFATSPTVTMRTANEAADSADVINRLYLNAQPAPTPAASASRVRLVPASFRVTAPAPAARPINTIKETPPMPEPVANPLTLVMNIKSPDDYKALKAMIEQQQALPPEKNPIAVALGKLKMVHFARFVFLNDGQQLAVITTYDGQFEDYIDAFVNAIGPVFDAILAHVKDWPAQDAHGQKTVSDRRDEFLAFVEKYDLKSVGPLYSAYPSLSVQAILSLQHQAATASAKP